MNGLITKLTVKENSIILMEIFLKDNGSRIKLTDLGFTIIKMELDMKDFGKMIYKKGQVLKYGQINHVMKVLT